ncbi:MAG TPA: hypothetical protein VK157_05615, partial [Phycisphaerales bacterium]|nr:hypothetical protein [Phycisphaerales bacterium]
MKMKKSLLLAITAGAVAPVAAFAQQNAEDVPVNDRSSQRRVVIKQDGTWYPLEGSAAPFTPRATVTVYDSFPTVAGTVTSAAAFNGISLVGDDISFAGTPWATAAGTIVQMEIPARHYNTNPVPPASGPTTADLVIEMWDEGSLTASPMGAGTPFNTTILEGAGLATVNAFPVNAVGGVFIFTPTTPIVVPGDGDIFLTYSWRTALAGTGTTGPVLPGPTSLAPFATSHKFSFYGWFNNNPANSRGATDEGMGFDMNGDGVLQGGAQVSLANPGRVANVSENRRVFLAATATPP